MVPFLRKSLPLFGILAVSFLVYACGGDNGGNGTEVETDGTIEVTVTADGSPRANVMVQLFTPGASSPSRATPTSSNGVATFTVEEGSYELEVVPPETFDLADGEDSRKSVDVVAGQTATRSFALQDVFTGETVDATADFTFNPSSLNIDAGTEVRWMNASAVLHTVTPDGHSEWTRVELGDQGDIFVHAFTDPGTYEYFCEPHVGQGMTGTIIVN